MPRPKGVLNQKTKLIGESIKLVKEIAPDLNIPSAETAISVLEDEDKDPWTGLTERQVLIQRLKMRGISQKTIGKLCGGISQTMVCRELREIREIHKQRGVALDKQAYIGESISIHEELLAKAWDIFHRIPDDNSLAYQTKLQALNVIASIKDKQTKLLTDLGILDKTPTRHDHRVGVVSSKTVVDNWSPEKKQKLAEAVLLADFEELEAPVPDDNIMDAEIEEESDEE